MPVETTLATSLTTCIVGGGNSAHVLIPFLCEAGHHVNLLTRRPDDWNDVVYSEVTDGITTEIIQTHVGKVHCKSSDPAQVIPDADIIILCMPVHQYRPALDRIAPFVHREKEVYIGTIYGQAGFNWMVHHEVEKPQNLENVITFAVGNIPWICRVLEYGKSVANYGGKDLNIVAVTPFNKFEKIKAMLLNDISLRPLHTGRFVQACSFLALTMSVDNQIIHPGRCYGLWKQSGGVWATSQVPYFYRDFDAESAEILRKLDADYEVVRQAIRKFFPKLPFTYMLGYLDLERLNHKSKHVDILSSLRDSKQLAAIKTPTVEGVGGRQYLDSNFRFFKDDIPYGLLVAKALAEMLHVETPFIDEVIDWAQKLRGECFLKDGKINREYCLSTKYISGIPESYGLTSMEDVVDAHSIEDKDKEDTPSIEDVTDT
jgi:hypothetical protein